MRLNILIGGKAGQGPNILTQVLGESLVKLGYFVFYSRDYQSLIRGGHNFNAITISDKESYSNDARIDVLVALDEKTEEMHLKDLKENGIVLKGEYENMFFAGLLFKTLGLDFKLLEEELKNLEKRFEENIQESKKGYESGEKKINLTESFEGKNYFINGGQGISQGAVKSGLDIYYAYPMTPATSVLVELANSQGKHLTIELENEIAVANAGVGSAITGKKVLVGTSGGGFDLMTETLSLCGQAEIPLVFYLAQRPGPGTGVATYTSQGDLKMALNSGHGEFQRVVVAPGDPKEAQELISQCFYLSQKYKIPCIILSDKHLAESFYTLNKEPKITELETQTELKRYNSYEQDEKGNATEDPEVIKENIEKRKEKTKNLESENFETYKIYGNKDSDNIVVGWGSVKGAVIDAIKDLDACFLQVLYLEPFAKVKNELKEKNIILVENNSTGMLSEVISEKTRILISEENKILRYDGRPFLADELKEEIRSRLK